MQNLKRIVLLAAMILGVSACGTDAAVVGVQLAGGEDDATGGDASLSTADAAVVDGAVASDVVLLADIAIGVDVPVGSDALFMNDSLGKDSGATTGGGLKNCGNGTCDPDETMLTCPADCKQPVNPQETCIQKGCPSQYTACQADSSCVAMVDCVNNTQNPQQCFQGGGGGMSQAVQDLFQCAQQANCFGNQGGGGNGGGTAATCGNGTCDQGESMLTCSKDCTQPASTLEACYHKSCPDQYTACAADPACIKVVDCLNTGGGKKQCGKNAAQSALNQCTQNSGCNTQGGGGGGTTPQTTCQGNCGNYDNTKGACQCDNKCTQYKDCCGDYQSLCGGGGTTVACGDGTCTSPQETFANCPADCGPATPVACKTKADCASAEVCCGLASGSVCLAPALCK